MTRTDPPPYLQLQYLPTEVIDPATGETIPVVDATPDQIARAADLWRGYMLHKQDRLRETRASIARRDARGPGAA
jgi:hypothetical protein